MEGSHLFSCTLVTDVEAARAATGVAISAPSSLLDHFAGPSAYGVAGLAKPYAPELIPQLLLAPDNPHLLQLHLARLSDLPVRSAPRGEPAPSSEEAGPGTSDNGSGGRSAQDRRMRRPEGPTSRDSPSTSGNASLGNTDAGKKPARRPGEAQR